MLGYRVAYEFWRRNVDRANHTVALSLIEKKTRQSELPLRAAGRQQRHVEFSMMLSPRLCIISRPVRNGQARKGVKAGHQIGLPAEISELDRAHESLAFDHQPGLHDVKHIRRR